ncbi:MAG: AMP-binding protein [Smithella sp.]
MKQSFILPSSIRLDRLFSEYARQTALIAPSGSQTFNDVWKCLQNVMINLEKAGVRKGHCVAFYGENQELHLYLFLASWMMNFLYMPLDFKAPLSRLISKRLCNFLITSEDLPMKTYPKILCPADVMLDNHYLPEKFCPRAIPFRREASVIFTSGSTGKPRGLVHTVGNYVYSALGTNEFIGITSADRWLISLPLFHVGGVLIWLRTLLAGGTSILPGSLKNIDQAIALFRPSVISLVPAQLIRLLDNPEMAAVCKSCRAILLGGAPMPAWLIEKALDMGLPIITSYGSTEGCSQITGVAIGSPREDYTTAGRPLPYRDIRIDSDGSIMLGGKTLFKRYYEDEKPSHLLKDGYFKTADAGRIDSNSNLVCLGRTDGIFISGGENIQPFEIENHLLTMENIAEAFVVPVDHHEFGKVSWAFLVTTESFNETALINSLKKILPGYKVPKRIIRLDSKEKRGKMKYSRSELTKLAAKIANNHSALAG